MPRNVEIKARIESVAALREKVAAIADHGSVEIERSRRPQATSARHSTSRRGRSCISR